MISLVPCKKNKAHARIAFSWRNDAKTIASSYIALPKSWASFWMEYNEGYFEFPLFHPVFIADGTELSGFVRFEKAQLQEYPNETVIEVMINIAPHKRGEGIGTQALILLQEYMRQKKVFALLADIRANNKASIKAFENAGFSFLKERIDYIEKTIENCHIECYFCKL